MSITARAAGRTLFFFADFVSNHLFTVRVEDGDAFNFAQRDHEVIENVGTLDQIASFATDGQGRLYAIGLDGEIWHLSPSADFGAVPAQAPLGNEGGGDWGEALLVAGALLGLAAWLA